MATGRNPSSKESSQSPSPSKEILIAESDAPSTDLRQFRKTNDAIGIRVREGKLSLLTRKCLNSLIFNAQQQRVPGVNAPTDEPIHQKYFWLPMSDLATDSSFDSKDTKLLKDHLEEMQKVRVVLEDDTQWTSEHLISSLKIINPTSNTKHGGRVWLGYAFPPEVHELVIKPGSSYTKLSMYFQSRLRTGSAHALYEVARRYATNPSHLTPKQSYEHWYVVLTGQPIVGELPPYKYFKRDVINKSMAEVNAVTDTIVELVEHKTGRRVTHLQFLCNLAHQPQPDSPPSPFIDTELLDKLTSIGMSQTEAQDTVATFGIDRTKGALILLQKRINMPGASPLESPIAYLRWALKDANEAIKAFKSNKPKSQKPKASPDAGNSLLQEFMSARNKQAYNAYLELPPEVQNSLFERFRSDSTSSLVKKASGLNNSMLRSLFSTWFAKDQYGEPSATELANYYANRQSQK